MNLILLRLLIVSITLFIVIIPFIMGYIITDTSRYIIKKFGEPNSELLAGLFKWIRGRFVPRNGRAELVARRKKILRKKRIYSFIQGVILSTLFYFLIFDFVSSSKHIYLYPAILITLIVWLLMLISDLDKKYCLIPDVLSFPALILSFMAVDYLKGYNLDNPLYAAFSGMLSPSIMESCLTAVYAYALCTILTVIMRKKYPDGFGGGDIKLLAFVGALCGMFNFQIVLGSSVVLFALATILFRKRYMPYAPFVCASLLGFFVLKIIWFCWLYKIYSLGVGI